MMSGVVTRPPELLAFLESRRPLESPAAVLRRERLHGFRLFDDVSLAVPVKFEEDRRCDGVARFRVAVDGVHLRPVEELHARHRHADLNRGDDRGHGALHRIERAHGG